EPPQPAGRPVDDRLASVAPDPIDDSEAAAPNPHVETVAGEDQNPIRGSQVGWPAGHRRRSLSPHRGLTSVVPHPRAVTAAAGFRSELSVATSQTARGHALPRSDDGPTGGPPTATREPPLANGPGAPEGLDPRRQLQPRRLAACGDGLAPGLSRIAATPV